MSTDKLHERVCAPFRGGALLPVRRTVSLLGFKHCAGKEMSGTIMGYRWLRPPRLRPADAADQERHATWFELFFDLVFVAAVAQLTRGLRDDMAGHGLLMFAGLLVPVWWNWVLYTFYADRFDTDDVLFRLLLLGGMLAMCAVAIALPDALGSAGVAFVVAHLAARGILLLGYVRAARHLELARSIVRTYGTGCVLATLVWAVSFSVPAGPARWWLWALAVAIEVGQPLVVPGRRNVARTPRHMAHLAERFGLFTIIVLGDTVAVVCAGLPQVRWDIASVVVAVMAFVAFSGAWWVYCDQAAPTAASTSMFALQEFTFGHLAVTAGLAAAGAGTAVAIQQAHRAHLAVVPRVALVGGIAVFLMAAAAVRLSLLDRWDALVAARLAVAVLAGGLVPAGWLLPPPLLAVVLAVLMFALVSLELTWLTRRANAEATVGLT
jgi:low temperature requirement protein LtrA